MTQVSEIMDHIDKNVTPMYEKIRALDKDINGNGSEGVKTRVIKMESSIENNKQDIIELKQAMKELLEKIDGLALKLAGIMALVEVVLVPIMFLIMNKLVNGGL